MHSPGVTLRRAIKLLHATALVVGIIIGASIFVQPSEITRELSSVGGILAVWLAAGALTMIGALICAQLAVRYPESGGVYVFLRETLSPIVGFLWGWAMFWSMHTGIIAAVAFVLARYAGELVPLGNAGTPLVAMGAILLISAINVLGVKQGSRLQTSFTIAKVAAIALLLFAGFAFGHRAASDTTIAFAPVDAGAFGRALAAGLFAFGGWHMVTYTAGETHDPQRVLPRALVLGVVIVVACYIALNALYLYLLPLESVAASTRVAADAASAVFGSTGATLISTLVVFSAFGALAGLILAGPRVYYAIGQDHALFRWLGAVHPRYQTPHRAIVLQAVWACVLVATGTYRALFTRVIYTEWIFFALLAVGLMRARSRALVLPVLFIVASLYVVSASVLAQPFDSAIGLGMVVLGVPVYYWLRKRQRLSGRFSQ